MLGKLKQSLSLCLALLFVLAVGVQAQTAETSQAQLPASVVTASIAVERARFTAPANVIQMRLEVFTAAGEKVFDSDFKPGNLLDWPLQDQQGRRLADGSYRCVVTTKDLAGRLAQKRGEVRVQAGAATFEEAADQTQTAQENGSSNATSREAFVAILRDGMTRATTVLAHDGEKGRLVSGSGGLSFRFGDFFAGKDVERMRLTPEGNLGVGLFNPQARLDVAGLIRTSEGIVFPDGTLQTTAANPKTRTGATNGSGDLGATTTASRNVLSAAADVPIYGMGTMNRLAKFAGINAIGDSLISEIGGNIGIGTPNPLDKLHVSGGGLRLDNNRGLFISDLSGAAKRAVLIDPDSVLHIGSGGPLGVNRIDFDLGSAGNVMTVNGGNVGIGTTGPTAKLAVMGSSASGSEGVISAINSNSNSPSIGISGRGASTGVYGLGGINGVYGAPSTTNGNGVRGVANSGPSAHGVWGESTTGLGVVGNGFSIGVSGSSASGIGVYGVSASGEAGRFNGKVVITRKLTVTGEGVEGSTSDGNSVAIIGVNTGNGRGVGVMGNGVGDGSIGVEGRSINGIGVSAYSTGQGRNAAALRAFNKNTSQGMAAYLTNASNFATAHFANSGSGEVLYLQNNGGPFIKAMNNAENTAMFTVTGDGMTITRVLQITGGGDLSEQFEIKTAPDADSDASPQQVQPGLVVSIDPDNPGKLMVSGRAYDRRVAGIVSGAGGVKPGMLMSQAGSIADGSHPVALTGRVYCWADASNGPIEPGDLLTTSNLPGHAMKVTDHAKAQGAIIGKAMTALKEGKGLILVLVTLQ